MKKSFLLFIVLLNILCIKTFAYNSFLQSIFDTLETNVAKISSDTLIENSPSIQTHSPKKATLLSTFIPGAGQVYNKQAWKVPIIYTAAAGVVYFAITNGKSKEKFKKEYYNRINGQTDELLADYITYTDDGIYNLYNAYKSNFQLSIIVGVVFYALQILDAYVYGHLFNFDLSEDLTMSLTPLYLPQSYGFNNSSSLGFSLSFKF